MEQHLSNMLGRGEEVIRMMTTPLVWMALVHTLEKTVKHESAKRDRDEMRFGLTEDT